MGEIMKIALPHLLADTDRHGNKRIYYRRKGRPVWAQCIGELFPMTHALRIARGLLLKGNGLVEIAPELWPIAAFTVVVTVIAVVSYRETLD
jgi:hypothetical protein